MAHPLLEQLFLTLLILGLMLIPGVYFWAWADAKLGGNLQGRVGPSRAGAGGWLQPLAEALRLLQKSNAHAARSKTHPLWWIQGALLFGLVALVPVGSAGPMLKAQGAIFLAPILGLTFAWVGVLLAWRDGQVEARLASISQLSLALAAFCPAMLGLLGAGLATGGFGWERFLSAQGWAPWTWAALSSPFAAISALAFAISGLILFSAAPFNAGADASGLIAAGMSGNTGVRLFWARWSRRCALFCWMLVCAKVFLGGNAIPATFEPIMGGGFADALRCLVLELKALSILVVVSVLGRTLPVVRADQAHDFLWRVLCPLALLALLGAQLWLGGAAT